jgi:carbonic anhydrase/acetyltransferase-like protein (isoleucine patch superfamily)
MSPIILPFNGVMPSIHPDAFIAPGAAIIGDVHIGADSSVWFGCVIRGDVCPIRIGQRTNIQDGTIIHVTRNTGPTNIGSDITIGHQALLHACTLHDACFVGMGAKVMDDAVVETGGYVAAGALLTPRKLVPTGQMWAGNPAKFFRAVSAEEASYIGFSAKHYANLAKQYK